MFVRQLNRKLNKNNLHKQFSNKSVVSGTSIIRQNATKKKTTQNKTSKRAKHNFRVPQPAVPRTPIKLPNEAILAATNKKANSVEPLYVAERANYQLLLTYGSLGQFGMALVLSPWLILMENVAVSMEKRAIVAGVLLVISSSAAGSWQWFRRRLLLQVRLESDARMVQLGHLDWLARKVLWKRFPVDALSTNVHETKVIPTTIFYNVAVKGEKTYFLPSDRKFCKDYGRLTRVLNGDDA